MTSKLQAGVHFGDALEHLRLTDVHFVLHPQLIGYKHASGIAGIKALPNNF